MPPESRKKLYDAVSTKFDIGSFDEFNKKMDDAASRKKFYDSVSNDFDLGDFNTFEGKISLKKKPFHNLLQSLPQLVGSVHSLALRLSNLLKPLFLLH